MLEITLGIICKCDVGMNPKLSAKGTTETVGCALQQAETGPQAVTQRYPEAKSLPKAELTQALH